MQKQFLDYNGLELLLQFLATKQDIKNASPLIYNKIDISDETIPKNGQIIIINDYSIDENGTMVPGIKIGNGINNINDLPLIYAGGTDRLKHALTIGEHVFDGSEDVSIEIYNGEIIEELLNMYRVDIASSLNSSDRNMTTMINDSVDDYQMTEISNDNLLQMITSIKPIQLQMKQED